MSTDNKVNLTQVLANLKTLEQITSTHNNLTTNMLTQLGERVKSLEQTVKLQDSIIKQHEAELLNFQKHYNELITWLKEDEDMNDDKESVDFGEDIQSLWMSGDESEDWGGYDTQPDPKCKNNKQ